MVPSNMAGHPCAEATKQPQNITLPPCFTVGIFTKCCVSFMLKVTGVPKS